MSNRDRIQRLRSALEFYAGVMFGPTSWDRLDGGERARGALADDTNAATHAKVRQAHREACGRPNVARRVAEVQEPFIVPDVTAAGESCAAVFHILRDMVEDGTLSHSGEGYRRVRP